MIRIGSAVGRDRLRRRLKRVMVVWLPIVAVAGIFHGYAYGESIVGAEPTALWAYLAGLALVQSAIGVGAALLAARNAWTMPALAPRLAGAAVFGIGISALAGQLIPG